MDVFTHLMQTVLLMLSITYPKFQPDFTQQLNQRWFDFIIDLTIRKSGSYKNNVYIIVGAGSAGATVASRLTEDPNVNVLLLEAGTYPPFESQIPSATAQLQRGPYDWQFKTTSQLSAFLSYENQQCNYPRGKVLGGTSTINGMVYVRGNRNDFNHWADLGNSGWSWPDVFPYFKKSEGNTIPGQANDRYYHNRNGDLTISDARFETPSLNVFLRSALLNGYPIRDLNARYQTGAMRNPFTMRDGGRCSTFNAFLQPALYRPGLVVGTESTVTKVLFDEEKRAVGVSFIHLGRTYEVNATKEVILSAGVIGSPHILMLSGVGPIAHLQTFNIKSVVDLPGVGQNFQDHVGNGALMWTVNTNITFSLNANNVIANWFQWFINRNGPLTSPLASEAMAFVYTPSANKTNDWPDVEILYASTSYANGGQGTRNRLGLTEETTTKYLIPIMNRRTYGIRPFLMRPKSRGTIQLQSADPLVNPLIDPGYLKHPDDLKSLMEAAKVAYKFGNSSVFRPHGIQFNPNVLPGCETFERFSDNYWNCTCRHFTIAGYHGVGSCKMGPVNDKLAVVNSHLRVYKTKSLRVVDASIMPTIVTGNTNAAVIMIAEKAADIIKKTYNLKP